MSDSQQQHHHQSFSERTYYAPFGRYQPGGEVGVQDNDVLVGRVGQRDYFIDLLFRMGRRGAFLVTGQRGVGKTSFVRHCLAVHEEAVCERFLSNNVGRAFFWDQLAVLSISFVALLALEMSSQLLDLLTLPLAEGRSPGPLAWLLLVPLIVVCLYPLLFAREVWLTVRESRARKMTRTRQVRRAERLLLFKGILCVFLMARLLLPLLLLFWPGPRKPEMLGSTIIELVWVGFLFTIVLLLFHFEYQWVILPLLQKPRSRPSRAYKSFVRLTIPWILFRGWLPILTIPVNLGFEKLDHRRVIHAMLAGLREKYNKAFLSWSSGFANVLRLLGAFVLLALVNFIGARWFELREGVEAEETLSKEPAGDKSVASAKLYGDVCRPFEREQVGPSAANLICKLPGGNTFVKILYYDLVYNELSSGDHLLLNLVLPYRAQAWPPKSASNPFLREGAHVAVYHLVLLALLYMIGRWLLRRFPVLPYEEILRRIDEVMDFLSARTSVTSRTNRWEPVQVFQGWLIDERTRQIDQDPADPRTVEFLFLQILDDIQLTSLRLGGRRHQLISLPSPEVTFLFDELDKLGTRVDPGEKEAGGSSQQAEILHAERKRSLELHSLLADMKNLLSSAPARFIFVGGRNLHDEWLADQGSRQPLLTNIFNAEVYLPSLLTDHGRLGKDHRTMKRNIDLYLRLQNHRAEGVFKAAKSKKSKSFLSLPIEDAAAETFTSRTKGSFKDLKIRSAVAGEPMCAHSVLSFTFRRDFLQFLTYRSMGNPKRLKELLGEFVRPARRVLQDRPKDERAKCEHVLAFGDTERFRIQLVARIYRHLAQAFEQRLVNRDDKLAVSLFYMADFLFKFHRRAFSWSNLERVDELVHIHRAPDLREILEALVGQWTERFLHPIRNGMYDFRFRSDLTREVEYISRQSPAEMAAFNFTLDESQALKSAYSTNISYLKEKTGSEPIDMVAGLGELHEFDQEYEDARVYYWRAISLLDARISEIAGELIVGDEGPKDDADSSAVLASFVGSKRGQRLTRHFLTWGISRVRLMLQIGMTFELTRNFERAGVEYRNANTLATALRAAMLDDPMAIQLASHKDGERTMHPLKHLNILFQPFFAEAWIAEKLAGAIDTGIGLVEKELWALRGQLPFVKELGAGPAESPINVKASNFSLIMAELHNKAGDLYFFKGRQRVTLEGLKRMTQGTLGGHEGYLLRAHYHYAVALQEMRRLISYRWESSPQKLAIWFTDRSNTGMSLETENWPDFIYRSVGGALNDLAEAALGRISLYGFLRDLPLDSRNDVNVEFVKEIRREFVRVLIRWMESSSDEEKFEFRLPCPAEPQMLESWFGKWAKSTMFVNPGSSYLPLVNFDPTGHKNDFYRLMVALQLKMAGSKMLERGGYIEGAAHELLGVCEIVTHYVWWLLMLESLLAWINEAKTTKDPFIQKLKEKDGPLELIRGRIRQDRPYFLVSIALYSLDKADRLFKLGRKAEESHGEYLVGNQIPVAQLLLTCSLGLAVSHWKALQGSFQSWIKRLLEGWKLEVGRVDQQSLREILEKALIHHSYPMVNRLQGLKTLIDHTLLCDNPDEDWNSWVKELIGLTGELEVPMHFTPLHSGVTYALAYCRQRIKADREVKDLDLQKIRSAARRDLETSEEMFTLRRAYYENISDLSYLYDDFNDRQIHLSHGIQMAGAEINALFRYLVTVEDQSEDAERP